jgi:hypothetical protein
MKLMFVTGQNGVKCIAQKAIFDYIDTAVVDTNNKDLFFNFKDYEIKIGDVLVTFNNKENYTKVYEEILKNMN